MANTIVHKISSVAAKVPLTTDLVPGELAINTADGIIYIKNDANSIVDITSNVDATKLDGQSATFYQKKTQAGFPQIADATLSSGTHTFDYASGDMQQLTASGDITIAFSNFVAGEVSVMMVDAVNWGAHTITLPAGIKFNDATAPTFTAAGTDRIIIINDKDNVVTMFVIGQAIA